MRADMAGSEDITTSLDRTPVTGSSEGRILWVLWNFSTRPDLYTRKKRNSWVIVSFSVVCVVCDDKRWLDDAWERVWRRIWKKGLVGFNGEVVRLRQ